MKYKIYKLVYNNEVIYVGKTKLRLLCMRKAVGYPKISKQIVKESSIELIEETDDKTREEYWRLYYIDLGCKLCNIKKGDGVFNMKEYQKEYYKDNKDYFKELRKDNKDYFKEYYKDNKDYFKEYNKEYQKCDKYKEYQKEYYKKNKLPKN